ncbi:hypothetical protein [Microbacterium sp. LWH10-1.2]|uniref:hypothetical protein n=1 Tax=Microbacterium sp. LWH10-1.2 TaxID=3135255 RepID=UPI003139426C
MTDRDPLQRTADLLLSAADAIAQANLLMEQITTRSNRENLTVADEELEEKSNENE